MKKLLSLLSVLIISGTAVPTTIAASSYEKKETIKNTDINYLQTNNLEKLNRIKRQGWRPAECFYEPIDYNRTIQYNYDGTWEYGNWTREESICKTNKAIREATIRAQQEWFQFQQQIEQERNQQRMFWKQKQNEDLARKKWENQKLLEIKQKVINMEQQGATISPTVKSALKIGTTTSTAAGGALLGSVIGVFCGPAAPACIAIGGAVGATLSEVIDRNL